MPQPSVADSIRDLDLPVAGVLADVVAASCTGGVVMKGGSSSVAAISDAA